jgi:transposase
MTISILGIDIAKNTFQLHGADSLGKAVQKKRLARLSYEATRVR